jgi:hypothetical protein
MLIDEPDYIASINSLQFFETCLWVYLMIEEMCGNWLYLMISILGMVIIIH